VALFKWLCLKNLRKWWSNEQKPTEMGRVDKRPEMDEKDTGLPTDQAETYSNEAITTWRGAMSSAKSGNHVVDQDLPCVHADV
jgi:hypothetical protein